MVDEATNKECCFGDRPPPDGATIDWSACRWSSGSSVSTVMNCPGGFEIINTEHVILM